VHLQVVRALEHLPARLAGVRHKAPLVLVAHVTQQRALQIENPRAERALKLGLFRRLTHGVDSVRIGDPFEPIGRGGVVGGGGGVILTGGPAHPGPRPAF